MEIDPDALTSAARLCQRQGEHGDDTARYVATVCTRPEAFQGVLGLFREAYAAALSAAGAGLSASSRLAREVGHGLEAFRDEVVATDETTGERMRRQQRGVASLPPVVPGLGSLGDLGDGGLGGWVSAGPPIDGLGWGDYADEGRDAALGDAPGSRRVPRTLEAHADQLRTEWDADDLDKAYDRGRLAAAGDGGGSHLAHDAGAAERAAWQRERLLDDANLDTVGATAGTWDELGEGVSDVRDRLEQIGVSATAIRDTRDDLLAADDFAAGAGEGAADVLADAERWAGRGAER